MAGLKVGFIPIEGGHYYRDALEEVVRGEELGFDSIWMEEHHSVVDHYWPSPISVLSGFATRTSRMTLGTDILVAPFYHPVRLAEDMAMLDVMSNGRAVLGIAIGYKPDEFALYDAPLAKRGARFEEQLAIVKALWTQDSVSFDGAYYRVSGTPRAQAGGQAPPAHLDRRMGRHHAPPRGGAGRQLDPRSHRRSRAAAPGQAAVPRQPRGGGARARTSATGRSPAT